MTILFFFCIFIEAGQGNKEFKPPSLTPLFCKNIEWLSWGLIVLMNYCRPNKQLIKYINKQGFTAVGNYAFYLILSSVNNFGYIPNFSNQIKKLQSEFKFSRNTGKNKIQSLIKLGWVKYDANKDILYIKSQDKIYKELNIGSSLQQIDVDLTNVDFKKLKYIINSISISIYQNSKIFSVKQQIKSGQCNVAKGNANLIYTDEKYNWVTGSSRREIASVQGSDWASTGSRKIKRLKEFNLIAADNERKPLLIKSNITYGEFKLFIQYKGNTNYYYFANNNCYQRQSNNIAIKSSLIKCYEKK